jgi:hypothetical protein
MTRAHTPPAPAHVSVAGLKARGWTPALITTFLGEPDTLVANPHYRSAAPMRLYAVARVEAVEASPAWQETQEARHARKAAAQRATQTKRAALLREVAALDILVAVLPEAELTARACAHYNALQDDRERWDRLPATPESHPDFLRRITVNMLRHRYSSYERRLADVYGKVGVREAYAQINQNVYGAIAAAYPALAEECAAQLARKQAQREELVDIQYPT